jgi:arylformamidase
VATPAAAFGTDDHPVHAALSLAGVHDLTPLVLASMNADLRLDEVEVGRVSPLTWPVAPGRVFDAVVGAKESSEFLRQSRVIVDTWKKGGADTRYEEIAGANHFTTVDPLTDPNSAMVNRLVELAQKVR